MYICTCICCLGKISDKSSTIHSSPAVQGWTCIRSNLTPSTFLHHSLCDSYLWLVPLHRYDLSLHKCIASDTHSSSSSSSIDTVINYSTLISTIKQSVRNHVDIVDIDTSVGTAATAAYADVFHKITRGTGRMTYVQFSSYLKNVVGNTYIYCIINSYTCEYTYSFLAFPLYVTGCATISNARRKMFQLFNTSEVEDSYISATEWCNALHLNAAELDNYCERFIRIIINFCNGNKAEALTTRYLFHR